MPTFDFRCLKCETVFEFSRPFGSKNAPSCPSCKSKKTEKIFGAPTVVFKGEGWYKTDSRPKAKETTKTDDVKETKKDAGDAKTQPQGSVPAAKDAAPDSVPATKKLKK